LRTSERDAASASFVELLDNVDDSKHSVDMDVLMDMLQKIQSKVCDGFCI